MSRLFSVVEKEVDRKYSRKVDIPQYLPSAKCPDILELFEIEKYNNLINNINKSSVSDEEKRFLRFAASRHIIFNYSKVADYYAHATKDMQKLMEESALVIIDFDDAIANGYIRLSKNIERIMRSSGESCK